MPTRPLAPASPLAAVLQRLDAASDAGTAADATSVPTGFPSVDRLLGGGLRAGDLVVLGGDVGSGKSAFALAVAMRAAQAAANGDGGHVAFLTSEMRVERVVERALAIEGRVRVDDLRAAALDDTARAAVGAAALSLRDAPLILERLPQGGVLAAADEIRRALDVRLAVVDGLESLGMGVLPEAEELASAVRALKALALEMEVAILVTADLPFLARDRADLRPRLGDFGAMGAVARHADVVLALFREEMYQTGRSLEGGTELLVLKNRNGAPAYADLYFYKQWLRFEDMLDPDR